MTPITTMYHKGSGSYVRWIHALHQEYGPVVRTAPDELSFIEPEAWKDIFGHRRSDQPNFAKDPRVLGRDFFAKPGEPAGITRSDDFNHARQRRLISAGFSDRALKGQEGLLKTYVDILVDKLRNSDTKVDMIDWFNFTIFDIMADLTFAEPLHLLENSSYSAWVSAVLGSFKLMAFQQLTRQISGLEALLQLAIPKSVVEKRRRHMEFSARRVDNRLAMETTRPDIWTYVLRFSSSEENKDRQLSLNEMYSISSTFMTAGTETTATLLGGLTFMLLTHPQKMERLVSELRGAFPTRQSMTLEKLAALEYLNACVDEALRVYPPAPTGQTRIVPESGAQICGHYVAGGVRKPAPHVYDGCSLDRITSPYRPTHLSILPRTSSAPTNSSPNGGCGSRRTNLRATRSRRWCHSRSGRGIAWERSKSSHMSPRFLIFQPRELRGSSRSRKRAVGV
jgi:cytochrome P450